MQSQLDEQMIREVIKLAREAVAAGEDPFAALLVKDGQIVAKSIDQSIQRSDPTAHAERQVISDYCQQNQLISLEAYTLYSFVEPCIMCAGAIKWAKISRLVFCLAQHQLQQFSGGKVKPACEPLINSGNRQIPILGSVLAEEGLALFRSHRFTSKKEKHRKRYGN